MSSEVLHTLLLINEQETENLAGLLTQDSAYAVKIAVNDTETTASVGAIEWRYQLAIIDDLPISHNDGALRQASVDLIRKIKTNHPETEIIFLTNQHGEHAQTALEAGAFRYLLKPINGDELMRSLRQAAEYQQLKCEKQIFESLLKTSAALSSERNQREVLQVILRGMQDAGFDRVRLYLLSRDRERLVGLAQVGMKDERFVGVEWPVADDMHMKKLIADPRPQVFSYAMGKSTNPEDRLDKDGLDEWLSVPLLLRGEVIGQLSADNIYSRRPIINRDLAPLALFADQAAAAIENARLFEETQQRADQLDAVRRTTLAISSTSALSRGTLLETITKQAVNLLRAKSGGIYKYFPEREELEIIADHQRPEYLGRILKKGEGMAGQLVESGAPFMIVDDYNNWGNQAPIYAGKRHFGAVIEVPLCWQEQTIGVLYLDDEVGRKFTEEEARLLDLFAQQAAIALANKYLIDRDEERLAHLEKLSRYMTEIMGNLGVMSLPDLLTMIARHATEILNAEVCTVLLVKHEGILSLEASYGHREGGFPRWREFPIRTGLNVGLTSHIAHERKIFNAHGKKLIEHFAVRGGTPAHTPSGECHSLLAIPLKQREGRGEKLVGLLRVDNKKGQDGLSNPALEFTKEDEWILDIFAEAIVAAIESAQRTEELGLLMKAGNIVAQAQDLSQGLQSLAEMLCALFPNAFCRILLSDDSNDDRGSLLVTEAACSLARSDNNHLKWSSILGQPITVADYRGLEKILTAGVPELIRYSDARVRANLERLSRYLGLERPIQSLLMVPLKLEERVLGMVSLGELQRKQDSQFKPENIKLAAAIAAQSAVLIHRLRSLEETKRREELLRALAQASERMRATQAIHHLLPEIVRLATQLVGCQAGGLWVNLRYLGQLELRAAHGIEDTLLGSKLRHHAGLVGMVACTGKVEVRQNYSDGPDREDPLARSGSQIVIAFPLKQVTGEVEAVLLLGDRNPERRYTRSDREILERFAAQASLALQTAQYVEREQLRLGQLAILNRISNYIQEAKDREKSLHAMLTGVTAEFGLRFNRAALLLVDEFGEFLNGEMGIGQLTLEDAQAAWRADDMKSFDDYIMRSQAEGIVLTPIGESTRRLRLPMNADATGIFAEAMRRSDYTLVEPHQFDLLPADFRETFQPATPLVIAPLIVKEQAIGALVADNKFSWVPIADEDAKLLMTFANTAALTLDNLKLWQQTRSDAEKLRAFHQTSNTLSALQNPDELPQTIAMETLRAAGASWVSLFLIDEQNQVQNPINVGNHPKSVHLVRPAGLSMQVMREGKAIAIPDNRKEANRLNPTMLQSSSRAAVCLPLSLPNKRLGVLWVHYDQPHRFTQFEIGALQLYVDQVAIAYENAHRIQTLERIRQASDSLARVKTIDEVLKQILQGAREVLRADAAVLWAYDAEWKRFIVERSDAAGIPDDIWEEYCQLGPRQDGTAFNIMQIGWELIGDAEDEIQIQELGLRTQKLLREFPARGFQGIALKVGEERLGVLYALYRQSISVNEGEKKIALTFATHAALALQKARLLEQLQKATQAAEAVAKVSVFGDHQETLNSIVKEVKEAAGCDAVVLFEYNRKKSQFMHPPTMIGVNHTERVLSLEERKDYLLIHKILDLDEPYPVEEIANEPDFKDKRFARDEEIRSCIAVPLQASGQKVGVMFVNYRRSFRFSPKGLRTIQLLANQAAVAMGYAQLLEERARQLSEQRELVQLSKQMLSTVSMQEVMDLAVKLGAKLIGTEFCNIVLLDQNGKLVFRAAFGWEQELVDQFILGPGRNSQTGYTIEIKRPVRVDDYHLKQEFEVPPIVIEHGIQSGMSVPMFRDDKVVGAMIVHTRFTRQFSEDEEFLLQLLANQTAIAIRNVQRYEDLNIINRRLWRTTAHIHAVHEASKAITRSYGLDQKEVLDQIAKQTLECIRDVDEPKAVVCTIQLYDQAANELVFQSIYPGDEYSKIVKQVGERQSLDVTKAREGRIGITGRTILKRRSQLVPDVRQDHDYIEFNTTTLSELSVPLKYEGEILGALNVESDQIARLDEDDQTALEALAEHVVIAIKNAQQYQELKETIRLVGARTALAWVSMNSFAWGHSIGNHASTINDFVNLLYDDLKTRAPEADLKEKLGKIEEMTNTIHRTLLAAPLSDEEGVDSVLVCDLIGERINQLRTRERSSTLCGEPPIEFRFIEHQVNNLTVRVSSEWLKRAFNLLVDNAIEAMAKSASKVLTVDIRLIGDKVEIRVSDTGKGIPPEIQTKLLQQPIHKPKGAKGAGIGLLLAQVIAQAYGGDIRIGSTGEMGTTMIISLPCEGNETTN